MSLFTLQKIHWHYLELTTAEKKPHKQLFVPDLILFIRYCTLAFRAILSLSEPMFSVALGLLLSATLFLIKILISVGSLTHFCGNAFGIPC